jgi:hypothetical protein
VYVPPVPVTVAGCPAIVTAGVVIDSLAVIETEMTSFSFALDVLALLEEMRTDDRLGVVLSTMTALLLVVVEAVPLFPAKSENVIEMVADPSLVVDVTV